MRFPTDDRSQVFQTHMRKGEEFVSAHEWKQARAEFEAALRVYPNHRRAEARLELVKRRFDPNIQGFEVVGDRFDAETGLPSRVRVTGLPIEMVLISGGDVDIGDDKAPGAGPAHTVSVKPFYMPQPKSHSVCGLRSGVRIQLVLRPDGPVIQKHLHCEMF
jgi:hypothetical protein